MAYLAPTPVLGMKLADPATVQAFETVEVNADFMLLENGIKADRVRLAARETAAAAAPARPGSETEFSASQALDRALLETPDARPDAVARAAKLANDPNYPPLELINRLARLVAQSEAARE